MVSARLLPRHLMVWRVFALRYMLDAIIELLCVDVAVLVGLWLGVAGLRGVSLVTDADG